MTLTVKAFEFTSYLDTIGSYESQQIINYYPI